MLCDDRKHDGLNVLLTLGSKSWQQLVLLADANMPRCTPHFNILFLTIRLQLMSTSSNLSTAIWERFSAKDFLLLVWWGWILHFDWQPVVSDGAGSIWEEGQMAKHTASEGKGNKRHLFTKEMWSRAYYKLQIQHELWWAMRFIAIPLWRLFLRVEQMLV